MAYIGKTPVIGNFVKLDSISVVNGQAAYTMQNGGVNFTSYDNVNQFLVSLNGVLQAPTDSFTVSGSTLTFASNLSTGDVIDFVLVLGNSLDIGTPSDNTVTAAKLNNDIISGQTALASEPADTDEFLVSDAGTLKRIDYSLIKGGGKVLQVAYVNTSTEVSVTSSTWTDLVSTTITPASTSNKVLALCSIGGLARHSGDTELQLRLRRDSTTVGETKGLNDGASGFISTAGCSINELDAPSSTFSLTYKLQLNNRDGNGTTMASVNGADTSITLLEIQG